jgi:hypothetical protein
MAPRRYLPLDGQDVEASSREDTSSPRWVDEKAIDEEGISIPVKPSVICPSAIMNFLYRLKRLKAFIFYVFQTADTLQIKGLAEKFSEESMGGLLSGVGKLASSASKDKPPTKSRLLSVPSQHSVGSRQYSTESLPEYFNRYY